MPAMYSVLGSLAVLFMAQTAHAQLTPGTANAEVTIMLSLETGESLEIPLTKSLKTAGKMVGSAGLDATSAAKWGTGSVIQWRSKTQFANVKGAVSHDPSGGKSRILVSARDQLGETVTCGSGEGKATIPVGGTDYCITPTEAAAWTKWKSATISGTTWTVYIKSLNYIYYCITSMSTSCQCDGRAQSFGTQGNFYACDWETVVRMADRARVAGDIVSNADALAALGETQACYTSQGNDCTPKDPGCSGNSDCGTNCGGTGPNSQCPASDGSDTTSCSSHTSQTCSPTAAPTAEPTAEPTADEGDDADGADFMTYLQYES